MKRVLVRGLMSHCFYKAVLRPTSKLACSKDALSRNLQMCLGPGSADKKLLSQEPIAGFFDTAYVSSRGVAVATG